MTSFLTALTETMIEAAPWLLGGFALSGVLKEVLDARPGLMDPLRRRGPRSVVMATLIGLPLPLCSCSVLPTALTLRRSGASRGATSSFLITVPETDLVSMGLTWALLGPLMAVWRPIASLLTGLLTGLAVDAVDRRGAAAAAAPETSPTPAPLTMADAPADGCSGPTPAPSCCCSEPAEAPKPFLVRALRYGFVKFFDDIAPTLILGLIVGAALTAWLPMLDIASITGSRLITYAVMLGLGIPMYVCAASSTPVAAGLIVAGVSPGAALVFLLAGPATNSASLLLLRRELGGRAFGVYLGGIMILSTALGLLLDAVLGDRSIALGGGAAHVHESHAWPAVAAAVVFTLLLLSALWRTKIRR